MKIKTNRYIDALLKLILFSAVFHMILLIIYALIKKDILYMNYFNILDLDLFFPGVINGTLSQISSLIFAGAIYFAFFFMSKRK